MSTHLTDSLYTSYSQIHRAVVQYSSTTTGEIHVIIPAVTGLDTSIPVSYFGREAHPFENDWVVPNVGASIIVCREDEDYTSVFWINTTYNPVRDTSAGEVNPTAYNFGPAGSVSAFDLIDFGSTPTSSGLYLGSVNMGYYNHTASEWRTYMDYNGNFYLRGSGTNALTWNGSTLAVSGAITASTIDIGTGNTILKVDAAGNLSIGHATPSSAPFQVSNAGAVSASNLTITGGGININSGAFIVTSAGALTATNATITGAITATSGTFTGTIHATGGTFTGNITAGTNAWHLDGSGNMWWGNFGSYSAAAAGDTTYINSLGAIRATNLAITGGSINIDANFTVTSAGAITATSGTIGGWSLSSTKIYKNTGTDEVRLDAVDQILATRGGAAVLRGYSSGTDIRIGIAGNTAYQPTYNQVDDVAMTRESGVIKFSVEQALTVNDGVVTIASPSLTGNPTATTQSAGNNSTRIATTAYVDAAGGSGTVTSVATSGAITGGPFTTSGTIGFNEALIGGTGHSHSQYDPALSTTTHLSMGGLWQTGANGTIQVSFGNMNANVTPASNDLLMFTDTSNSGAISYCGASVLLNMVGEVSTPVTHDFYLSGSRIIQATGNIYIRSNSGQNYGMTAWTTGQTDLHYGTGVVLKTSTSGVLINGGTLYPGTNGIQNLGASNLYWKYLYATKMDRSAIPTFVGTGAYLVAGTNDTLYAYTSSERLKKNIVTIPVSDALNRIKALRPVEFSAKTNPSDLAIDNLWEYERFKGFIAEEAAAVDHGYGVYNWWKSNDPESEDYDKPRPSLSAIQDEWTNEEVAAYYDLDEAAPHVFDSNAILADAVAAMQEISTKLDAAEARIAVLETT
jgi:hypothetical protein